MPCVPPSSDYLYWGVESPSLSELREALAPENSYHSELSTLLEILRCQSVNLFLLDKETRIKNRQRNKTRGFFMCPGCVDGRRDHGRLLNGCSRQGKQAFGCGCLDHGGDGLVGIGSRGRVALIALLTI